MPPLLVALQSLVVVIGVPLFALYWKERVKNIAREATDKALADYRHQHDRALATMNAENQRRLHESSLYAREKHRAYAELYRRVRMAAGLYDSLIGLTISPRFESYTKENAEAYAARNKVLPRDMEAIYRAIEARDTRKAGELLSDLHTNVQRRAAERAFMRAKNFEVLHELYFSDEVRVAMDAVRRTMAIVSVSLMREKDERDRNQYEKEQAMNAAVVELYDVMRDELRLGYPTGKAAPGEIAGGSAVGSPSLPGATT